MDIIPKRGERASVFGMTGSGKTSFVTWLMKRIEDAPIIIYDTKTEPKFEQLPHSTVVENTNQLSNVVEAGEHDYIVLRPHYSIAHDPRNMDEFLLWHFLNMHGLPAYIDEANDFCINGRGGVGMKALLKKGRSKGITTILSSQRPVGLERSIITETNRLFAFRLQDKKDRQRIDDVVPDFSDLPIPDKHFFYYMEIGEQTEPTLFKPVKLDPGMNSGYVDQQASAVPIDEEPRKSAGLWI